MFFFNSYIEIFPVVLTPADTSLHSGDRGGSPERDGAEEGAEGLVLEYSSWWMGNAIGHENLFNVTKPFLETFQSVCPSIITFVASHSLYPLLLLLPLLLWHLLLPSPASSFCPCHQLMDQLLNLP